MICWHALTPEQWLYLATLKARYGYDSAASIAHARGCGGCQAHLLALAQEHAARLALVA